MHSKNQASTMTTRYMVPSVESIQESSEDEAVTEARSPEEESPSHHHHRSHESAMKANTSREREKSRKHKSAAPIKNSKRSKGTSGRRTSALSPRGSMPDSSRRHPNRSACSSTSSSEAEDEQDHRAVLAAARARLTSPSMISNFTSQTTATNKSSSSSGSNSTITQASITKRMSLVKRPEIAEEPLSPAVPDPPTNVFAFLEKDSPITESRKENDRASEQPKWARGRSGPDFAAMPLSTPPKTPSSSASSASSSFRGDDNSSEPAVDNDTDRSSSPDSSMKGPYEAPELPQKPPTDHVSVKIASQMAAAHTRQQAMQQFGTPEMPRGHFSLPHVPSSTLSTRYPYQARQQLLPRAEKLPVTGYEALASRLASSSYINGDEVRIKPMYRKFEALNHRLLLHLQDELSELEEQLHRLDNADTQSRRTEHMIMPASRRAAAHAGGELQFHKMDILGRIGFKLNQYNAALASFNSTQALAPPAPSDIDQYRSYLHEENPIAEWETHFLDPADDLVSLCSEHLPASCQSESAYTSSGYSLSSVSSKNSSGATPSQNSSSAVETSNRSVNLQTSALPTVATAIATAILVPIVTFNVIPGFLGRMTVAFLVGLFMVWALIQSETIERSAPLGREGMTCLAIYAGVMTVIAGIMA